LAFHNCDVLPLSEFNGSQTVVYICYPSVFFEVPSRPAEGGADRDEDEEPVLYETDDELDGGGEDPEVPDAGACEAGVDALLDAVGGSGSRYEATIMGPLAGIRESDLVGANLCGAEVRHVTASARPALEAAIADAAERAAQFDGYQRRADHEAQVARQVDTPETHARLVGVARKELPPLSPGETIPYIRLPTPPSIAETACLWALNDRQALAFACTADILLREVRGEVCRPLRLLLTGKAGTGKSRVLQALQWYALQVSVTVTVTDVHIFLTCSLCMIRSEVTVLSIIFVFMTL